MRHLLTLRDLARDEFEQLFTLTDQLKSELRQGVRTPHLKGRVLGLLFAKPSLRTRVSFEAGMAQLGGTSLYLGQDVGWGSRESVADFGRVLSQYLDVLVCRTHRHDELVQLARYCSCPVINGLTDQAHPCQALADLYTLREHAGSLASCKLAFIGDGNNVARSLAHACATLGVPFTIAAPEGYELDADFVQEIRQRAPDAAFQMTHDPVEAVHDATAVYTDVWSSMGFEHETDQRRQVFTPYQVNAQMMACARRDAVFLHCLPAHRGEEVTDEVIDSPQSLVVPQAANRMHVQKALLWWMLGSADCGVRCEV